MGLSFYGEPGEWQCALPCRCTVHCQQHVWKQEAQHYFKRCTGALLLVFTAAFFDDGD